MEVNLERPTTYFPLDRELADQLKTAATAQGVSLQTLLNRWVQQKIEERSRAEVIG